MGGMLLISTKDPLGTNNSPTFYNNPDNNYTVALAAVGGAFALADGITGT